MNIPFLGKMFNPTTVDVAEQHRKQQLMLGYLIGEASKLALIVNSVVVTIGMIRLAYLINSKPPVQLLIAFGFIGVLVAILADSQTLATAARIRLAREQLDEIEIKYNRTDTPLTPTNEKRKEDEEERVYTGRFWNIVFLVFFVIASGGLGDIFWNWVLSGIGNTVLEWIFSSVFSLLISFVMVSSELTRRTNNRLIAESIDSENFMASALKSHSDAKAITAIAEIYEAEILSLAKNSDSLKQAVHEHGVGVYDVLLCGGKGKLQLEIKQAAQARQFAIDQERELSSHQLRLMTGGKAETLSSFDRVARFMEENPRCINKDIVAAFPDIPSATVKVYASQIRNKVS